LRPHRPRQTHINHTTSSTPHHTTALHPAHHTMLCGCCMPTCTHPDAHRPCQKLDHTRHARRGQGGGTSQAGLPNAAEDDTHSDKDVSHTSGVAAHSNRTTHVSHCCSTSHEQVHAAATRQPDSTRDKPPSPCEYNQTHVTQQHTAVWLILVTRGTKRHALYHVQSPSPPPPLGLSSCKEFLSAGDGFATKLGKMDCLRPHRPRHTHTHTHTPH
jgi:hypothetical protein